MKIRRSPEGFTLIELLVVISIIAVLASLAVPAAMGVKERGDQMKDLSNAKQIYLGLKLYSTDNDGQFPNRPYDATAGGPAAAGDITTSNEAFRNIVPSYVTQEKIFYVARSVWTTNPPDENTAAGSALASGENAYAYVKNLSDNSNPSLPIIADAFGDAIGTYALQDGTRGGVWKGKSAVVIRVDGSAKVEKCNSTGQVMGQTGGGNSQNIFTTQSTTWLSSNQTAVNPG